LASGKISADSGITPLIKEKNQESTIVDETISPENQK